jgi:FMN phosphatase YigB (HAD superfamily)
MSISVRVPKVIFFDFGGVLVSVRKVDSGFHEVAVRVTELLESAGCAYPDAGRVECDVRAGAAAYENWKDAQSRRGTPREISHREFWEEFVAADWSPDARALVSANASPLSEFFEFSTMERLPNEGALALLIWLQNLGISTGCISNALAGKCSRKLLREFGMEKYLSVQVYSDEVGVRKPNPDIFRIAMSCLGVRGEDAWYVGDKIDRDILAGRRAAIGMVVLMPPGERPSRPSPMVFAKPDHTIKDLGELRGLLENLASHRRERGDENDDQ